MEGVQGVRTVHDLHTWTLSSGLIARSAHVVVNNLGDWEDVLGELRALRARNITA